MAGRAYQSFRRDWRDWMKGVSETHESLEGGFSNYTTAVSLKNPAGLLGNGLHIIRTNSNGIAANTVVYGQVLKNVSSDVNFSSFATDDGAFYTQDFTNGNPTLVTTDGARTYTFQSDMIRYNGKIYTTSNQNVGRSDYGWTSNMFDWWTNAGGANKTALTANVPHRLAVLDEVLYITNGQYLNSYDGSGAFEQIVDLGAGNIIVDIAAHKGLLEMIVASSADPAIFPGTTRLVTWDGLTIDQTSGKGVFNDDTLLGDAMTEIISHSGDLLMAGVEGIYTWNGQTCVLLRKEVGASGLRSICDDVFYTSILETPTSTLYRVMRYGSPIAGRPRVFFPTYQLTSTTGKCSIFLAPGVNRATVFDDRDIKTMSLSTNSSFGIFRDLNIPLPESSFIRAISIETEVLGGSDSFAISYFNSKGQEITVGVHSGNNNSYSLIPVGDQEPTNLIGLRIDNTGNKDIRAYTVYYEPTENLPR